MTDIIQEIKRACIIIGTISQEFDEAVCYKLFQKDSLQIWRNYENLYKHNIAKLISDVKIEHRKSVLEWTSDIIDLDVINESVIGDKIPEFAPPKQQFINQALKERMKNEAINNMKSLESEIPKYEDPKVNPIVAILTEKIRKSLNIKD